MNTRMDLTDDTPLEVTMLWSKKYACPIYRVAGKLYVGLTGEYGGYFEEIKAPDTKNPTPKHGDSSRHRDTNRSSSDNSLALENN